MDKVDYLIAIRGRNTAAILADAERHGITGRRILILCRENDQLAEEGDVTVLPDCIPFDDDVVVIANGGTTPQLVLVMRWVEQISRLSRLETVADMSHTSDHDWTRSACEGCARDPEMLHVDLRIVDVQRDGLVWLD